MAVHGKKPVLAQRLTNYVQARNADTEAAEAEEQRVALQTADNILADLMQVCVEQ